MMSRNNKKHGVPDRWLDYKAVGKRLAGTRFIAFKVPLKQSLNRKLPRSEAFGLWELLDAVSSEQQELGMIIDLTFTTRYYRIHDVPDSLLFVKIFTAGHQVPTDATILSFKRAVRGFLRDNADNDKLIGVHCTHGLNRTGYLICRYLIDVDGMDPKDALELFNASRGHDVERQNYVDDLQRGPKRSNVGMEKSEQEPLRGRASHRRSHSPSDSDSREERRTHHSDSPYHRSFAPRGTNQRSHHHQPLDGLLPTPPLHPPPLGAPLHPYRWSAPHLDSQRRRPQDPRTRAGRSGYPAPEEGRSRYPAPEKGRSRYPAPEEGRSRYPAPEEGRSRYPAPEEGRSRYPAPEKGRSRYPAPEEGRSRYPAPEEGRSRYPAPEEGRSRYPAPEEGRSRYPAPESRYPAPEEGRSRYPAPESRYPAPEEARSRYPGRPSSRLPEDRRRGPAPPAALPRYAPQWAEASNGCDRREEEWAGHYTQKHNHRVGSYDY